MSLSEPHERAKQPVSAALAGPYGHPFHPLLVTVPIGAWVASLVFDVATLFVADPAALATASTWLLGLGVLGAVAAALVGMLDLFALTGGTRAHRVALLHMTLNLAVTTAYALNFAWRYAAEDTGPVGVGKLTLSAVSLVVLGVAGWLGGRLAFHYGVRVAAESDQAAGHIDHERNHRWQ